MNKKIVHDALVLMTFALVLGGILGAVYQIQSRLLHRLNTKKHRLLTEQYLLMQKALKQLNLIKLPQKR